MAGWYALSPEKGVIIILGMAQIDMPVVFFHYLVTVLDHCHDRMRCIQHSRSRLFRPVRMDFLDQFLKHLRASMAESSGSLVTAFWIYDTGVKLGCGHDFSAALSQSINEISVDDCMEPSDESGVSLDWRRVYVKRLP